MEEKLKNFIDRAQSRHGDKYDYSKVEYNGIRNKVCIICPIHGEFWQYPQDHIRGNNCPICANENRGRRKRYTKDEFVEKSKEIHGDKYDYSKVEYKNVNTTVPFHDEGRWPLGCRFQGCLVRPGIPHLR